MRPTRLSGLAAYFLVAAAASWLLAQRAYGSLPPLPRYAPVTLLLLAMAIGYTAASVRARLQGRPRTRPIVPIAVARHAALAKACSGAGALFAGLWTGWLIFTSSRLEQRAAAVDAATSGLGIVAALALVGTALWLERVCRVPRPPARPDP
ncbi:MAG: DUF3180 domain-containing protein [Mycobacteriales bacterium]